VGCNREMPLSQILDEFWESMKNGNTDLAVMWLQRSSNHDFLDLSDEVDPERKWNAVQWGAYLGDAEFITKMISLYDVPCNQPIPDRKVAHGVEAGSTALHIAVKKRHTECVKTLIEHRAKVNAEDRHGWTSLHRAVDRGRMESVRLLLDLKADINATIKFDTEAMQNAPRLSTALHMAVRAENTGMVKLLIGRGSDRSAKDKQGTTCDRAAQQQSRAFWDAYDDICDRDEMKISLLMATNRRVGASSAVRLLMFNKVFDPQIFFTIFELTPSRIELYYDQKGS